MTEIEAQAKYNNLDTIKMYFDISEKDTVDELREELEKKVGRQITIVELMETYEDICFQYDIIAADRSICPEMTKGYDYGDPYDDAIASFK